MVSNAEFTFDEATHTYRLGDRILPSVSEITKAITSFDFVNKDVLERRARLGTAVHKAIELLLQGRLARSSLHPEVKPYLNGFERFLSENKVEVMKIEEQLYHPSLYYAGTMDLACKLDGKRTIIDYKIATTLLPTYKMQTAAYAELWKANYGDTMNRAVLQLKSRDYKLEPHKDPSDSSAFKACLVLHSWREKNDNTYH